MNAENSQKTNWIRIVVLSLGLALAGWLFLFADLVPEKPQVSRTAAIAVLMATLWITEWIPLGATAILPVVLLPIAGVQNGKEVSSAYFDHIVFLFVGGFIVALAMQKWDLHRRIALNILARCGTRSSTLLFGFMFATSVLSMWISNTAATMMMVTIASAILVTVEKLNAEKSAEKSLSKFSNAILLGTAYAASIGGISTLVGTPPNLAFARIMGRTFERAPDVDFVSWIMFALPISIILFGVTWSLLYFVYLRKIKLNGIDKSFLKDQIKAMGKVTFPQYFIFYTFLALVVLWITRAGIRIGEWNLPGWSQFFPHAEYINDGTVAIAIASILFFVPAFDGKGSRLMDWPTMVKMPWNIVLLFGGGFALAGAFKESGLSAFLGSQMQGLADLHPLIILACICLLITFLTELTSNTATTEMILPLMASLAVAIEIHPLILMIPVTISCSCAFMMPVATPPNAIVFGTNKIKIREMVRVGIFLNLIGVVVVVLICYLMVPIVLGFEINDLPHWAVPTNP